MTQEKRPIDIKQLMQTITEAREEQETVDKLGDLSQVDRMLTRAYQVCKERGRYSGWEAYDRLLDFMGYELGLYERPLDAPPEPDTWKLLRKVVNFRLMADFEDNLGRLITVEEINRKEIGQILTPGYLAEMMVKMTMTTKKTYPGMLILDPAVGPGVFLIKWAKHSVPGVKLYGIDIDHRAVRACMVQLTILKKYAKAGFDFFILRDDALIPHMLTGCPRGCKYRETGNRKSCFEYGPDWSKANRW